MGGNVAENLSNSLYPKPRRASLPWSTASLTESARMPSPGERLAEIEIPEELRDNLALFLRLERRVLSEYDPEIADLFDKILTAEIVANAETPAPVLPTSPSTSRACHRRRGLLLWRFVRSSI